MTETRELIYTLPNGLGSIRFSENVISHFERHRQRKCFSREAGGQLFASTGRFSETHIVTATGPRKGDARSLFSFVPNREREKREISEYYANGLHFVGDWHTHPQQIPVPSLTDISSMNEMVRESSHDLPGFLMVIVGLAPFPNGLHVSFNTSKTSERLGALQ